MKSLSISFSSDLYLARREYERFVSWLRMSNTPTQSPQGPINPYWIAHEESIQWIIPSVEYLPFVRETLIFSDKRTGAIPFDAVLIGWANLREDAPRAPDGKYLRRVFWMNSPNKNSSMVSNTVDPFSVLPMVSGSETIRMLNLVKLIKEDREAKRRFDKSMVEILNMNGLNGQDWRDE